MRTQLVSRARQYYPRVVGASQEEFLQFFAKWLNFFVLYLEPGVLGQKKVRDLSHNSFTTVRSSHFSIKMTCRA